MRDRLIELIDDFIHTEDVKYWYSAELDEQLADYLLANGVIVPPCKVGDKVYNTSGGEIKELIVRRINIEEDGFYIVFFPVGETTNGYWCGEDRFGKNVFLNREEAEKALASIDQTPKDDLAKFYIHRGTDEEKGGAK